MSFPKSFYEKQMVCYNQYRQYRAARDQVRDTLKYLNEHKLDASRENLEEALQCLNSEILLKRSDLILAILERLDAEKELTIYLEGGALYVKKSSKGYQYGSPNYSSKISKSISYRRDYYSQNDVRESLELQFRA